MSNTLAIATVTASLQRLLQNSVELDVPGVTVKISHPKLVDSSRGNQASSPTVNIYLYQVLPNIAQRNNALPSRHHSGAFLEKPQVALDLYYLISFYGDEQQVITQRLLGSVISILNRDAIFSTDLIKETIQQPLYSFLADSNLADQVEEVKFTPKFYSLEETSKLWTVFFQTAYALSVAYQASVVLIESDVTVQTAPEPQDRTITTVQMEPMNDSIPRSIDGQVS